MYKNNLKMPTKTYYTPLVSIYKPDKNFPRNTDRIPEGRKPYSTLSIVVLEQTCK